MNLSADISTQLVWALANTEAHFAGETVIRPVHFFLGILKVIDANFLTQLQGVDMSADDRKKLRAVAKQVRHFLEMPASEITRLRRSLRGQLRKGKQAPGEFRMLHRSDESRDVFRVAGERAVQAGGATVSALHLTAALFATGHVSLDNIKHPIDLPSSKDAKWKVVDDLKRNDDREYIDWFGRNLTQLSVEGGLAPFEGREDELRKMLRTLNRTAKRHIAVIGRAGVGKTSLVEGLASLLARRKAADHLRDCEVLELHGSDIASDCGSEAELSRRINHLFRLLSRNKSVILFLDDLQGLFPGHLKPDAAYALLATLLSDDIIPCVVTCLDESWASLKERAPTLARLFNVIELDDPSTADCRRIANAWAVRIGEAQGVRLAPDAIEAILQAVRCLPSERGMTDRIVDFIENTATFVKVAGLSSGSTRRDVTIADVTTVLAEHYGIREQQAPLGFEEQQHR